jgi:hypothetical protein
MIHVDTDVFVQTAVSERKTVPFAYRKLNADLILVIIFLSSITPFCQFQTGFYNVLFKLIFFNVSFVGGNVLQPITLDDLCKVQ